MLSEAIKRLSKHSAIYAVLPAISSVTGFVLLPLVTRFIKTRVNYGIQDLATVTIALAVQVLGINLLQGMTRFYTDYAKERERATLVTTNLLLLGATTGLACLVGLYFRVPLAELLFGSGGYSDAFAAMAAILFFQTLGQVGLRYLQVREMSLQWVGINTAKLFLEIGLKLYFLIALEWTYMGILYSVLIGEILLTLIMTSYLIRSLGLRFSKAMARRVIRFSYPLALAGIAGMALHQADRYIIRFVLGPDPLGLYAVSYKLGAMINAFAVTAFTMIWFPYVFSLKSQDEIQLLCRKILTYFSLILVFGALALSLFSRELVELMTPQEFHDAYRAIPQVAWGYVFWGIFQVLATAFYLRERTGRASALIAVAAGLNILLTSLAVPQYGYVGAAWATLLTFLFLAITAYSFSERLLPVGYELGRVGSVLILGVALLGVSFLIPKVSPMVSLALKGTLLVSFPLILFVCGFLTSEERGMLQRIMARKRET